MFHDFRSTGMLFYVCLALMTLPVVSQNEARPDPYDGMEEDCRNLGEGCGLDTLKFAAYVPARQALPAPLPKHELSLNNQMDAPFFPGMLRIVGGNLLTLGLNDVSIARLDEENLREKMTLPQGFIPTDIAFLPTQDVYAVTAFRRSDSSTYDQNLFFVDHRGKTVGQQPLDMANRQGLYLRQILALEGEVFVNFWTPPGKEAAQTRLMMAAISPVGDSFSLSWQSTAFFEKYTHGLDNARKRYWLFRDGASYVLAPQWGKQMFFFRKQGKNGLVLERSQNFLGEHGSLPNITGWLAHEQGYFFAYEASMPDQVSQLYVQAVGLDGKPQGVPLDYGEVKFIGGSKHIYTLRQNNTLERHDFPLHLLEYNF